MLNNATFGGSEHRDASGNTFRRPGTLGAEEPTANIGPCPRPPRSPPFMRVALLSDVHANLEALNACLADAVARGADQLVFLGSPARTSLHAVMSDDLAATVLELADANRADLIVLGAPGPSQRAFAWWRSAASTITANAACSVYVVRTADIGESAEQIEVGNEAA